MVTVSVQRASKYSDEHFPEVLNKLEKPCFHHDVNSYTSVASSDLSYLEECTYVGKPNQSETITMINALRNRRSLPSLTISPYLRSKAEEHADNMAMRRQMRPSFRRPPNGLTAVIKEDIHVSSVFRPHNDVFELIECGSDVDSIRNRILRDQRCLLLRPNFTHVGLGATRGDDEVVYVCIEFDTGNGKSKQGRKTRLGSDVMPLTIERDDKPASLRPGSLKRDVSYRFLNSTLASWKPFSARSMNSKLGSLRKSLSYRTSNSTV